MFNRRVSKILVLNYRRLQSINHTWLILSGEASAYFYSMKYIFQKPFKSSFIKVDLDIFNAGGKKGHFLQLRKWYASEYIDKLTDKLMLFNQKINKNIGLEKLSAIHHSPDKLAMLVLHS